MEPTRAIADFRKRIAHYEAIYEPLDFEGDEEELPGIKIIDCRRFVINKVRGYLPGRITQFVMSLHTSERTIYMTRHGQSEYVGSAAAAAAAAAAPGRGPAAVAARTLLL
jgi:6-phosphofructo-2-kinase/fructose-2,6-biphosphatase 2